MDFTFERINQMIMELEKNIYKDTLPIYKFQYKKYFVFRNIHSYYLDFTSVIPVKSLNNLVCKIILFLLRFFVLDRDWHGYPYW